MVQAKTEEELLWDRLMPLLQEVTTISQRIVDIRKLNATLKEFQDSPSGGKVNVVERAPKEFPVVMDPTVAASRAERLERKRESDRVYRAKKRAEKK